MTAGIVVDNYKLDKFKEELTKLGYKFHTVPFIGKNTTIKVEFEPAQIEQISQLCKRLELHFKRSN